LSWRLRRDFFREAAFRCTTPLVTALSNSRIARARLARASSTDAAASAVRVVLTAERTEDRTAAFRTRRFTLWRIRLRADRVLAIESPPSVLRIDASSDSIVGGRRCQATAIL
jgi:hypothetical protein